MRDRPRIQKIENGETFLDRKFLWPFLHDIKVRPCFPAYLIQHCWNSKFFFPDSYDIWHLNPFPHIDAFCAISSFVTMFSKSCLLQRLQKASIWGKGLNSLKTMGVVLRMWTPIKLTVITSWKMLIKYSTTRWHVTIWKQFGHVTRHWALWSR